MKNIMTALFSFILSSFLGNYGILWNSLNRIIEELNQRFNDGEHIIYVNGAYQGHDDIGNLMNDFRSASPDTMVLEPLREVVDRYKNNPQEVAIMCAELEKWSLEERQEGESNLAKLLKALKADGRFQDMDRVLDDDKLRKQLYEEYRIY